MPVILSEAKNIERDIMDKNNSEKTNNIPPEPLPLPSVSPTPHVRDKSTTGRIMGCVLLGLLPATAVGILNFGPGALVLVISCMALCIFFEWGFEKICKKKSTIKDLSAALTGLLLALNLPVSVPWYVPVIGSFVAIIVIKQLFGGLGQNFMNPALGARCFLVLSFSKYMTDFSYKAGWSGTDVISSATPLADVKNGMGYNLTSMFLGNEGGTIGETSALALLIGGLFLICMGVITWHLAGMYLLSLIIFVSVFGGHGFDIGYIAAHLFGGGLMLGAFFMATDYVTRPITRKGQIIYGIFLGILTGIFRIFGPGAEGVSYAIITGNLIVPLIEKITVPRHFGYVKVKNKK